MKRLERVFGCGFGLGGKARVELVRAERAKAVIPRMVVDVYGYLVTVLDVDEYSKKQTLVMLVKSCSLRQVGPFYTSEEVKDLRACWPF